MTFRVLFVHNYNPRKNRGIFFVRKMILPRTKEQLIIDRANFPSKSHYFRLISNLRPRYDIYHIQYWTVLLSCYFIPRPKIVYEPRGWQVGLGFERMREFCSPRGKVLGRIFDKLVKQRMLSVDRLVVGGPDLYEEAVKIRKDVIFNPWAVDLDTFNPKVDPENLEGNPAVSLLTRLDRRKGIFKALMIWREIKKNFPRAKLHILEWGELLTLLKKTLKKDVVWHSHMSQRQLARFYRGSDLVLGQFLQGTLGMIEKEAMACFVPVVVYDKYDLRTTNNLDKLAIKLLKDRNFRQTYIKRNYNYVIKHYNPDRYWLRLLKIYEDLLELS